MKHTYTDGTRTTTARSYREAAENLYGCTYYQTETESLLSTLSIKVHRGYAEVSVYKPGDKQGTYWGVKAATPARYTLRHE